MTLLHQEAVNIAVTQEVIDKVKSKYKDITGDSIDTTQTLFLLGFEVRKSIISRGWGRKTLGDLEFNTGEIRTTKHCTGKDTEFVRDPAKPSQLFETKVWRGFLRNQVLVGDNGLPVFDKQGVLCYTNSPHHLEDMYKKYEVVTGGNFNNKQLTSILDVGDITCYNDGFSNGQ